MRWKFPDSTDRTEQAAREEKRKLIRGWWQAFEKAVPAIQATFKRQGQFNLPQFMRDQLGLVDNRILWEFGPAVKSKGHRLVLSPESRLELEPLVREVLALAPKISGWEYWPYRLAGDERDVIETTKARTGGDIEGAKFRFVRGKANTIDVEVCLQHHLGDERDQVHCVSVALETILGEEDLQCWMGQFALCDSASGKGWVSTSAAQQAFKAVKAEISSDLPALPFFLAPDKDQSWSLYQLNPDEEADPDAQLPFVDAFSGAAAREVVFGAAMSQLPFIDERLSRCGETHAFLMIDASDVPLNQRLSFREVFTDAVDKALSEIGAGGVWGGLVGLNYVYILVALVELPKALPAIRRTMQQLEAPRKTWLRFFDARLRLEWLGAYADSPPPCLEV